MWCIGLTDRTDRPLGCYPLTRFVRQNGRQLDLPGFVVDCGCLDRCDAMLSEALAHNIKSTGERRIAKGPINLSREWRADGRDERFFRIGKFALGLGERGRDCADRFTGAVHWPP